MKKNEILLESGTNELEIMEFKVRDVVYGINILKVREIVQAQSLTVMPKSHPYIMGVGQIRGELIPVIDLGKALGSVGQLSEKEGYWIVTEMNQNVVAFLVDSVTGIDRLSWADIQSPSNMVTNEESSIVGLVKLEDKIISLLDFEKILTEINPIVGINKSRIDKIEHFESRRMKHILIAEDSTFLIQLIKESVEKAGYVDITVKYNGKEMWDYLEDLVKTKGANALDNIHCLITDIEMPVMDGLHLTKRVKDNSILNKLPVVIFSSLITPDLRHKGESVGANAQVSKPEIETLVDVLDSLLLNK
ncbi:MAG: chemotaxis protein CheV [Bacillales bacterium]|jgi:two-component system chemotaxis response regulator CheV|nr:chemotaxis protein CheV [Bacillales bacterium]